MNATKKPLLSSAVRSLTTPKRAYPVVDWIIILYVAAVLVFQTILQISPLVSLLTKTPFYSMQTYLGILGGGLILLDLVTTKRLWQGKFCILLYGILLLAALASVRTMSYGLKENIFKLCWSAIYFTLVYSCAYRFDRATLIKCAKVLFFTLLAVWFIACCVSLYQYAAQIGYRYVVNPLGKDASNTRQGFYDSRLFGIFYTLNHAAYISLLFIIGCVFYFMKSPHRSVRIALVLICLCLGSHILLSGSRSARISLILVSVVGTWLLVRRRMQGKGLKQRILPLAMAVVMVGVAIGGTAGWKEALRHVPYLAQETIYWLDGGTANPNHEKVDKEEIDEMLDREELEADSSNGRLSIWLDYLSLYKEIGPIGLSPGNYMAHILESNPELYIVDYIKQEYPAKYDSGIIYHTHNGYLLVFVATGWIGIACLIAFIALCVIRLVRTLRQQRQVSLLFVGCMLIAAAIAVSAMLDEGLFFQNHLHTTLFWFALGVLMKECVDREPQEGVPAAVSAE